MDCQPTQTSIVNIDESTMALEVLELLSGQEQDSICSPESNRSYTEDLFASTGTDEISKSAYQDDMELVHLLEPTPIAANAMHLEMTAGLLDQKCQSTDSITSAASCHSCPASTESRTNDNGNNSNNNTQLAVVPSSWPSSWSQPELSAKNNNNRASNTAKDAPSENVNALPALPPKPKRGLTAYNLFFSVQRREILKELPDRKGAKPRNSHGKMGFKEMAQVVSARWKSLSAEEKEPYEHVARNDRLRYKREMKEWKRKQQEAQLASSLQQNNNSATQITPLSSLFLQSQLNLLQPTIRPIDGHTSLGSGAPLITRNDSCSSPSNAHDSNNQESSFLNIHWSHGGDNIFLQSLASDRKNDE